jgi:3-keto-disaccharide hydrolase
MPASNHGWEQAAPSETPDNSMNKKPVAVVLTLGLGFAVIVSLIQTKAQAKKASVATIPLDSLTGIEAANGSAEIVTYNGRRALHLAPPPNHQPADDAMLGIVTATNFRNGTIEVEVAGKPRADAPTDSRGFIGIVFRAQDHGVRGENFYLRPTNGRADDQLRRNHTAQYESLPDFPWHRLRKENPGVYESYADLEAGAWTKMKIVVSGSKAQLYVNGAEQPCLIVNDLKLGDAHGQIALWSHSTTEGYFSNLKVSPAE